MVLNHRRNPMEQTALEEKNTFTVGVQLQEPRRAKASRKQGGSVIRAGGTGHADVHGQELEKKLEEKEDSTISKLP